MPNPTTAAREGAGEPMNAVWGVYNRERELVMLKPYDCTGNGWPEGYTVERLPLATPEMVAVLEAARRLAAVDWDMKVTSRRAPFSRRMKAEYTERLMLATDAVIDAARAAGGAHGS